MARRSPMRLGTDNHMCKPRSSRCGEPWQGSRSSRLAAQSAGSRRASTANSDRANKRSKAPASVMVVPCVMNGNGVGFGFGWGGRKASSGSCCDAAWPIVFSWSLPPLNGGLVNASRGSKKALLAFLNGPAGLSQSLDERFGTLPSGASIQTLRIDRVA